MKTKLQRAPEIVGWHQGEGTRERAPGRGARERPHHGEARDREMEGGLNKSVWEVSMDHSSGNNDQNYKTFLCFQDTQPANFAD
jgi:hypothetical protein